MRNFTASYIVITVKKTDEANCFEIATACYILSVSKLKLLLIYIQRKSIIMRITFKNINTAEKKRVHYYCFIIGVHWTG